ncbi:MAG: hypothetical protein JWQ36_1412 [Enterovirga sp.]|jgi:methionine-rich copper-binding protein CopC|nr:hypothetical protein [Enterovirga sp.]
MRRLLVVATVALLATSAAAHENAKGPNGGPVIDSAGHHLELVTSGTELTIFLSEQDNSPIQSAGSKNARAVVQDGGKTVTVPLQPAAPNKLVGALPGPLGKGARVVVSATMPDGHAVQGRFVNN